MKKPFFARYALFVLMVIFFLVPFAMRGSRWAVQRMKNDVKDWLPADFPETAELEWFRQRFLGEQFVVVSWEGCHGNVGDEKFRMFVDRLFPELPPSAIRSGQQIPQRDNFVDQDLGLYVRNHMPEDAQERQDFIGNQLLLHTGKDVFLNWGGRQEKWLRSGRNEWIYITPQGELYQWHANRTWPAQLWRSLQRAIVGKEQVEGELVASLGPFDGPWYYSDPRRLNARLFKSVTTGPSVLSKLTQEPLNISREEAHNRLRGVLFGPDDRQTCIVVTLTQAAKEDPRAVVGRGMLGKTRGALLDVAEASGIRPPTPPSMVPEVLAWLAPPAQESATPVLRLGGPPVDNAAIDEEGQITLARLLGLSLLVGLGLSWLCFRSVSITIMVFLVGGISAVTSVGIVYWTGSTLDAVLMSMPSLVYVLGISGAVHVVNYYRESVHDRGLATAPGNAVKIGWAPCTMAAITTALGLISLAASNITPIRKFGIYSAVGVVATLVLLFTYLPAALEIWPPRRFSRRSKSGDAQDTVAIERILDSFWQAVGRWVTRHYRFVTVACLCVFIGVGYGLTRINTSIQLLKLFDGDARIIRDYEWFEANLGKLVPMEIVIKVAPHMRDNSGTEIATARETNEGGASQREVRKLSFLERMEIAERAGQEIERIFGEQGQACLGRPMLASTFAPEARGGGIFSQRLKSARSKTLEESRQAFVDADFLRVDPDDDCELWRISLRLAALSDIDFGVFVERIQMVLEPMLIAHEYRDLVLRQLATRQRTNRGQTVCLVGFPKTRPESSPSSLRGDQPEIDQTRIFAHELYRLLKNDELRVVAGLPDRGGSSQTDSVDCFVILQDDPELSEDQLAESGAMQITATDHQFDPATDSTAQQRKQRGSSLGVSAVYTGLVPIVYKAQRTLLTSLFESVGLAFVMIACMMMLILRSPSAGLISMFPNVFPVVLIFGIMGWRNVLVDIGSMMTASVAMGVAVDDTIHFLSWFRRGLDEGCDRKQAILLAYRRVATAMTQTTAIGGLGLSIFAFSTFTPTQRFGTLMLALLAAALIGDLLFLPALLAGPLGRVFDSKKRRRVAPAEPGIQAAPHIGKERARTKKSPLSPHARRDSRHQR